MTFFVLEPEVAGGFGPDTVLNREVHPPRPTEFDYQFDGWLGDPLIETVANFIITVPLKARIEQIHASGADFDSVKISKSGEFDDLYPDVELPKFVWIKVLGIPGKDDFGLSHDHRLVVSERILAILKDEGMKNCDVALYT